MKKKNIDTDRSIGILAAISYLDRPMHERTKTNKVAECLKDAWQFLVSFGRLFKPRRVTKRYNDSHLPPLDITRL